MREGKLRFIIMKEITPKQHKITLGHKRTKQCQDKVRVRVRVRVGVWDRDRVRVRVREGKG